MAQANQGQRQWRGPEFEVVSFETTDPNKTEKGWEVVVVATVAFHKTQVPRDKKTVLFEVDGLVEEEQEIDDQGKAGTSLTLNETGSYLISVQIKDMPASRRTKKVSVKRDTSIVKSIALEEIGTPGNYKVVGRVLMERGKIGVRKVQVNEIYGLRKPEDIDSNDYGVFSFEAKFAGFESRYLVTDIESGVSKEITLLGLPKTA